MNPVLETLVGMISLLYSMARIFWPTGGGIPSDALPRMLGPEFSAFHLVLNWDTDFKFCVLVPRNKIL